MKRLNYFLLAAFAAGVAQTASAVNYLPTHLLLVFRQDGQKDVEFDIGSVSNYLGQAVGTQIPINYNRNAVITNFGGSLSGVKFAVAGAVSQEDNLPRIWLTDASVYSAPANLTYSAYGVLHDKIDSVGVSAALATASNAAPYVVSTASGSSYDYLVTSGVGAAVSTMYGDSPVPVGGVTPLPVDAVNPTTLAFYEVRISTANPKPASELIGSFTIDSTGSLYFTAGELPPLYPSTISSIVVDTLNGSSTISFTTSNGANYRLFYSTSLGSGVSWAPVPGAGSVAGDGTVQSLTDYNATDPMRFYRVKSTY